MDLFLDPSAVMGAAIVLAIIAATGLLLLLPGLATDVWRWSRSAWGTFRARAEARREIRESARAVEALSAAALQACAAQQPNRAAAYRARAREHSQRAFALAYYQGGATLRRRRDDVSRQREADTFAATCLLLLIAITVLPVLLAVVRDFPMLGLAGVWLGFCGIADYLPENGGAQR
jgi:hypothetical protein